MNQITVRYLVLNDVCTDVLIGDLASIQFNADRLRVKLASPGQIYRDWAPHAAPIVTAFYEDAVACYFGPVEQKYLDVA